MMVYKVEERSVFDRGSYVINIYYFKSEIDAEDFVKNGNKILEKNKINHKLFLEEEMDIDYYDLDEALEYLKNECEWCKKINKK